MRWIESVFPHLVIRYRWWIIIISVLLVALAGSGARLLSFTTNYRIFFSEDNPQLLAFEALENTYVKNDNVLIVLAPDDGNVFTRGTLDLVEQVTTRAWQIPYSNRVDSITNFQYTEADGDELVVRDLISDAASLDDEDLSKAYAIAMAEPLLYRRLISDRGHVTAINVNVQLPRVNEAIETPEVVNYVREIADDIRMEHPDIKVYLTGMVMMNNSFVESSKNDMEYLVPFSFCLMLFILGLFVGGLTGTFSTLLVILFSIITAMGLGGYLGMPLSPPSASAPTIILTVAIASCVHILATFAQERHHGLDKNAALTESIRINLQPIFLASFTTALGFLSMNFSDVPPFRHLGNFVSMGVLASFFLSVTLLPALLAVLPVKTRQVKGSNEHTMTYLGNFIVSHRTILLRGMAFSVILLILFIPRNELNDIFVHYFDESITFRSDSDFMTENLTGLYNIEYSLDSGEAGGISNPDFLREVANFADWYRKQPETLHVNVYTEIMKRLNRNMHGDDPQMYKLPDERDLAAQYLLLYEMSLPYGLDMNNQINIDKSATRMTATLKTISSNEIIALDQRAQHWMQENAPDIRNGKGSGTSIMFANIGKRNIISMLFGTTFALIMISLILVIALRSFRIGFVSLIPNLVPAAMGFGLWGMFVGEVGLSLSVVASMTLGIVVDDTVHFLSKYQRARREKALSPEDAVRYAFRTVGRALIITSVVLVAGFLVLSMSSFELNSGMGLLTAIVITFALAADFLLLPPLLIKIEEIFYVETAAACCAADTATP